jgi:hypothetical protein
MRKIGVVLPDQVFERVEERASRMQIDVSSYLATAISELVLKSNGHEGQTEERTRFGTGTLREMPRIGVAQVGAQGRTFDIESAFRRFPKRSTSFAQRFVDEAAKIANVGFRRNRRGIGSSISSPEGGRAALRSVSMVDQRSSTALLPA